MLTDDLERVGPITLSLPRIVGSAGVVRTLLPTPDAAERALLRAALAPLEEALAGRW